MNMRYGTRERPRPRVPTRSVGTRKNAERGNEDFADLLPTEAGALARQGDCRTMLSMFISIDGGDGAGKSTQVELLCDWFRRQGREVVACRDPGSTPLGEAVRDILLHRHDLHIDRRSEMFLYMAARAQMVEEVIRPALEQGKIVVSDRYLLANVAYQGYGGRLDAAALWEVGRVATGGLTPDVTIVLDVPSEVALERMARPLDRMERQGAAFHARVRDGFLVEAARAPDKMMVVDAGGTVEEVQARIREKIERCMKDNPKFQSLVRLP